MKFYNREKELKLIHEYILITQRKGSRILVISGRRRIGKTRLVLEGVKNYPHLYLFVRKKRLNELIQEWSSEIRKTFGNIFYGNFSTFEELMTFLFEYSRANPFALIFDEVQNLQYSRSSEFAIIQKVFDLYKNSSKILLLFTGSSYSLMEKIFKDLKEPLFGRASEIIHLSYFTIETQTEILHDHKLYSGKNLLHLFSIFDGIPKYIEELTDIELPTLKERIKVIITSREFIWDEGENILKEEFGKDYASYFSIISAIAKGRRKLSDIEQFTGILDAGAYLKKLEKTYKIIERKLPVTSKSIKERKGRYYLIDNFFAFWFRFIEAKKMLKEIGKVDLAFQEIWKDLKQYEGRKLEDMFIRTMIEKNPLKLSFNRIGKYWDRKGKIEIDTVILDDLNKIAYLFEVKINKNKITANILKSLKNKGESIPELKNYKIKTGVSYLSSSGLVSKVLE